MGPTFNEAAPNPVFPRIGALLAGAVSLLLPSAPAQHTVSSFAGIVVDRTVKNIRAA
ncbi:hypothetical protein GGD41_005062 [Paraburkholderia bryophila]|uniref:Uncharacterized protein n=1 Tax=Paraburkholderia bryophila TaxID=420952 RepID=A0A7Y9WBL3_9BURK|nr:hypothetical protein [Paraburkholderia bryophila]